jgi:hypothetical protein
MNPEERFVIKRSLHKLIEENDINNDEIVRNALSHFDGSNNNEKISKILDFSENLVDNYSKELIESDKYKDIKLLFDKYFKKYLDKLNNIFYGRGKKNNFYLIKVFREVLKPYVEQYNPIPLEFDPTPIQIDPTPIQVDPTPLQNNNLNEAIKSVIDEEFPIINLTGSINWLNSEIIRINNEKDKSEQDKSAIKHFQEELEKNIENMENFKIILSDKEKIVKHLAKNLFQFHISVYEKNIDIYHIYKNLHENILNDEKFKEIKKPYELKSNELDIELKRNEESNKIKSFINLLNVNKKYNISKAYTNLNINGFKIFDYLTENNFVKFTHVKKVKEIDEIFEVPFFLYQDDINKKYYTLDDLNEIDNDLHKYNFLLLILVKLNLKKFNKLVDYLHDELTKNGFYDINVSIYNLVGGVSNTSPMGTTPIGTPLEVSLLNEFGSLVNNLNSYFKDMTKKALENNKSMIISIIIFQSHSEAGHANAISIHKGRVELFDSYITPNFVQRYKKLEKYFKNITATNASTGIVLLSGNTIDNISYKWGNIPVQHAEAYCLAYSAFYMLLRITYPELSFEEIYNMNLSTFDANFNFMSVDDKYIRMSNIFTPLRHDLIISRIENFIILMDKFNEMYQINNGIINFDEFLENAYKYMSRY